MKRIVLLGASGSIGQQTIDIISNNKNKFQLIGFSVGDNIKYANNILKDHPKIELVCVKNKSDIMQISNKFNVVSGLNGLCELATLAKADIIVTAVVGSIGLLPTIAAIEAKKDIGLANKETLVIAGHIIMPLVKKHGIQLLPIDSEHSAIAQCLNGENRQEIKKIILTASGGSFRDYDRNELKDVTVEKALNHPNWKMGNKITIDSATMFNKGLEIMEAHHLFNLDYDDIDVILHRQSIIHSMIEFTDTAIIAQLGTPDMRMPIQYALNYPQRIPLINSERLDLKTIGTLDFCAVDFKRYPAIALAYRAGRLGGSAPTVINAANEVAVELFLNEKIKFIEIDIILAEALNNHIVVDNPSIKEILAIDKEVRIIILRKWVK